MLAKKESSRMTPGVGVGGGIVRNVDPRDRERLVACNTGLLGFDLRTIRIVRMYLTQVAADRKLICPRTCKNLR